MIYYDQPHAQYHADKHKQRCFSYSLARILLQQSPAHLVAELAKSRSTKQMDFGQLAHSVSLGAGEQIEVCYCKNWTTKAAKEFKKQAKALGKLAVLAKDYQRAERVKIALEHQLELYDETVYSHWCNAKPEVSATCEELGVKIASRFDKIYESDIEAMIFDVKTCDDANPDKLGKKVYAECYDVQEFLYRRNYEFNRPELAGKTRFMFLFIETEEPFALVPVELSGEFQTIAASRYFRALETWKLCQESGYWPGYKLDGKIDPPQYALNKELGEDYVQGNIK